MTMDTTSSNTSTAIATTEKHRFTTTGVTCAGCANKVQDILAKLPGVKGIQVDHLNKTAEVEVVKGAITLDDLLIALRPAGYGLIPLNS